MKKTTLFTAFAASVALLSGAANAANSGTLAVTAEVIAACEFTSSTAVAFGNLNPATSPDPVAATGGSVAFWCTKGAAYTITMNDGANASGAQKRMKGPGATDFIPYTLTPAATTGTGAGKSTAVTVVIDGSVAKSAFEDATAGAYNDSVLVTITP